MATVASLNVALTANAVQFSQGMSRAQRDLRAFQQGVAQTAQQVTQLAKHIAGALAGGLAIGGFVQLVHSQAEAISSSAKLSESLGIAQERLMGLEYAAKIGGVAVEDFDGLIRKFTVNVGKAAEGSAAPAAAFARVGISIKELRNLSPDEVFARVADGIARIPNPAERASAAVALFGKSGTRLLPVLQQGADGIERYVVQAQQFGLAVTRDQAQKVEEAEKAMIAFRGALSGVASQIAVAAAPAVLKLGQSMAQLVTWIHDLDPSLVSAAANSAKWALAIGAAVYIAPKVVGGILSIVGAIKKLAAGEAIAAALSGPKGWATLAVGAAVAAASVYGINKAFEAVEDRAPTAMRSAASGLHQLESSAASASSHLDHLRAAASQGIDTSGARSAAAGLAELGEDADGAGEQLDALRQIAGGTSDAIVDLSGAIGSLRSPQVDTSALDALRTRAVETARYYEALQKLAERGVRGPSIENLEPGQIIDRISQNKSLVSTIDQTRYASAEQRAQAERAAREALRSLPKNTVNISTEQASGFAGSIENATRYQKPVDEFAQANAAAGGAKKAALEHAKASAAQDKAIADVINGLRGQTDAATHSAEELAVLKLQTERAEKSQLAYARSLVQRRESAELAGKIFETTQRLRDQALAFGLDGKAAEIFALTQKDSAASAREAARAVADLYDTPQKAAAFIAQMQQSAKAGSDLLTALENVSKFGGTLPDLFTRWTAANAAAVSALNSGAIKWEQYGDAIGAVHRAAAEAGKQFTSVSGSVAEVTRQYEQNLQKLREVLRRSLREDATALPAVRPKLEAEDWKKYRENVDALQASVNKALEDRAKQLRESLRIPTERVRDDVSELRTLYGQGLLSAQDFARGVAKAMEEVSQATKPRFASLTAPGEAAFLSASQQITLQMRDQAKQIIQSMLGGSGRIPGFADGGAVGPMMPGNYSDGDRHVIKVAGGEMVLTPTQQSLIARLIGLPAGFFTAKVASRDFVGLGAAAEASARAQALHRLNLHPTKYGRDRYDIEAAGLEHDATISPPPHSILGMRGHDGLVVPAFYDGGVVGDTQAEQTRRINELRRAQEAARLKTLPRSADAIVNRNRQLRIDELIGRGAGGAGSNLAGAAAGAEQAGARASRDENSRGQGSEQKLQVIVQILQRLERDFEKNPPIRVGNG